MTYSIKFSTVVRRVWFHVCCVSILIVWYFRMSTSLCVVSESESESSLRGSRSIYPKFQKRAYRNKFAYGEWYNAPYDRPLLKRHSTLDVSGYRLDSVWDSVMISSTTAQVYNIACFSVIINPSSTVGDNCFLSSKDYAVVYLGVVSIPGVVGVLSQFISWGWSDKLETVCRRKQWIEFISWHADHWRQWGKMVTRPRDINLYFRLC